jgi:hypothetical protein
MAIFSTRRHGGQSTGATTVTPTLMGMAAEYFMPPPVSRGRLMLSLLLDATVRPKDRAKGPAISSRLRMHVQLFNGEGVGD